MSDEAMRSRYDRVARGFGHRLSEVTDARWGDPTPCSDWSIRDLVDHVLGEQLWVPPLVAGESIEQIGDRFAGDQIGADAVAAWDAARRAVSEALAPEGVGARTVRLSYGDSSVADYVGEVTMDTLVHTWDLARATGGDDSLDPEAVDAAMAFIEPRLDAYRASGLFRDEVPVGPAADAQTRLLAVLGRSA